MKSIQLPGQGIIFFGLLAPDCSQLSGYDPERSHGRIWVSQGEAIASLGKPRAGPVILTWAVGLNLETTSSQKVWRKTEICCSALLPHGFNSVSTMVFHLFTLNTKPIDRMYRWPLTNVIYFLFLQFKHNLLIVSKHRLLKLPYPAFAHVCICIYISMFCIRDSEYLK